MHRIGRRSLTHAPSQPHRRPHSRHRAFTLTEILVASALTVAVLGLAAGSAFMFGTLTHTTPHTPARAASDAQVHQMIAELRNAVSIGYITPHEVIAAVSSNSSSAATPTVTGVQTGVYQVAYYFGSTKGLLYRNPGPSSSVTSSPLSTSLLSGTPPTPPTAPSVNPPGSPPQQPSCPSPCYNPSGAYVAYTHVSTYAIYWGGAFGSWSGNVIGSPTSRQQWSSYPWSGPYLTCCRGGGGYGYWTCAYVTYCDWTKNGAELYGSSNGYNNLGYAAILITVTVCGRPPSGGRGGGKSIFTVRTSPSVPSTSLLAYPYDPRGGVGRPSCYGGGYYNPHTGYRLAYAPVQSKTAYYYLPSCSCYLSQGQYTADVTNWNNYQNALNTYNQQYQAWQQAKQQWGAYGQAYSQYASQVNSWNASFAHMSVSTPNWIAVPGSGTITSGQWPSTSVWRIVADKLQNVTFTGYDANMNTTTGPQSIRTLGITVQYPGTPPEQEMLSLLGAGTYVASSLRPFIIPPAPPDPRTCSVCSIGARSVYNSWTFTGGSNADPGGIGAAAASSTSGAIAQGYNGRIEVSVGAPYQPGMQIVDASYGSGPTAAGVVGWGTDPLSAAAAAVQAARDMYDRVVLENAIQDTLAALGPSPPGGSNGGG